MYEHLSLLHQRLFQPLRGCLSRSGSHRPWQLVVMVTLALCDMSNEAYMRMDLRAKNVTTRGFDIAFATWGDTNDFDGTDENFPMYTVIENNVMREVGIFQKQSSGLGQAKAALSR